MRFQGWSSIAAVLMVGSVWACPPPPPANVKFQGTAFETQPFQVQAGAVRFFAGTSREIVFSYRREHKVWCYFARQATRSQPANGCLSRALKNGKPVLLLNGVRLPVFALRDLDGRAVATIRVVGHLLTADFLSKNEKPSGKRVVFRDISANGMRALDIDGWNCPNPRFLSCVGAHLQTTALALDRGELTLTAVSEVELSKRLGSYRASCEGLQEMSKRALAQK